MLLIKLKGTKTCLIKEKLKFGDCKNCLKETDLKNKINHLEKKIDADSLKKGYKEFIKYNELILKTQQRFKSERHNILTEENNNIVASSNYDKRMQSIDSIETEI